MEPLRTESDKNSLRWLIKSARPAHLWVLLSVGLGMTGGLLLVAQAGLLANIIQGVFIDRLPRNLLTPLFIGSAGVVVMRAVLAWGREAAGFQAGARVREAGRIGDVRHPVQDGVADDHILGGDFTFVPVLSEPDAGWTGRTGWVHEAVVEDFPDLSGYDLYMAGPPPMIDAARTAFRAAGMPDAQMHYDSFEYAEDTRDKADD